MANRPGPAPTVLPPPDVAEAAPRVRGAYIHRGQEAVHYGVSAAGPAVGAPEGSYSLNFDGIDIRDVARAVLGDMLRVSYAVAPDVHGTVTLHSANTLSRDEVLPALQDALQLAGAALVPRGDGYAIVAAQNAAASGALRSGEGYRMEVLRPHYITVGELQKLIGPLVAPGTVAQADAQRNLLVVGGSAAELQRVREVAAMFDVDWLRGQSFGLFPLQYSDARAVAADLQSVIGPGNLQGLVRIVPIEHMNAVLVVSPRAAAVEEMRGWVQRFDRGRDTTTPRLFVYHVEHGRAADLASVLSKALGLRDTSEAAAGDAAAPAADKAGLANAPDGANALLGGLGATGAEDAGLGGVRVTADETNNALLILATPDHYGSIESALRELDASPLQVLLQACVAEVHLTNELKYGLQYYFHNGNASILQSTVDQTGLAAATGGLSVAFLQGNDIKAVLDLLGSLSQVRVISAPYVTVLNNRSASIEVGDQVPVATSTAVGVVTANAPVVNTIQLLDTGIILRVTPRVGSGGQVLLDIDQEVSASVPTTSSTINSPTIQQRKISSSIAVQDGQTVAIGGLISDTRTNSRTGIPWLMDLPYVGPLFSLRDHSVDRTELIVLLTPRVLHDPVEAAAVTSELRDALPLLQSMQKGRPGLRPGPAGALPQTP